MPSDNKYAEDAQKCAQQSVTQRSQPRVRASAKWLGQCMKAKFYKQLTERLKYEFQNNL